MNNPLTNITNIANATTEIESQRAIQEVQAALVIAKKFPRNQVQAMDNILNSCRRITLAKSSTYAYPRGKETVTGASIRLAEAIAQNWGNIQYGIVELSQENGYSIVQAYAWDMETNTKQEKKFQVKHERYTTAKGNVKLTEQRDIYELVANNGARRLRACILGIIPGDITEAALEECQKTLKYSTAQITPEYISDLVKSFNIVGINTDMIKQYLKCRIEDATAAQLTDIVNIYNSIKDGMTKISDWFVVENKPKSNLTNISDMINDKTITDQETGEITERYEQELKLIEDIKNLINVKGQTASYKAELENNFADYDLNKLTRAKKELIAV